MTDQGALPLLMGLSVVTPQVMHPWTLLEKSKSKPKAMAATETLLLELPHPEQELTLETKPMEPVKI
jgi:hypothetical protein